MYQARLLKFFYLYAFVLVEYYFLYSKEAQFGFLIHLQSIFYWIYKDTILFTISCLSNSIWCYFSPLREVSIHITLAYCLEAPPPHLHHGTNAYILILHKIIYNISSLHHQNKCARKIFTEIPHSMHNKIFSKTYCNSKKLHTLILTNTGLHKNTD